MAALVNDRVPVNPMHTSARFRVATNGDATLQPIYVFQVQNFHTLVFSSVAWSWVRALKRRHGIVCGLG